MDLQVNKKNNKYIKNKIIDKYESINNKTKIFKITQFYNKISVKDIIVRMKKTKRICSKNKDNIKKR